MCSISGCVFSCNEPAWHLLHTGEKKSTCKVALCSVTAERSPLSQKAFVVSRVFRDERFETRKIREKAKGHENFRIILDVSHGFRVKKTSL
jgi:hypothetical protein